jgi:uncharacterized delta-60 repeat protein
MAIILVRVLLQDAVIAQPGGVETDFEPGLITGGGIRAITIQQDGGILIGGSFTNIQGTARNGIARLRSDGRLDATFANGTGISPNGFVSSIVLQPDGRIFMGGFFTNVHGIARAGLARLQADGTLDENFIPDTRLRGSVLSLALESDQKLLVGTDFIEPDTSQTAKALLRLETNGKLSRLFLAVRAGSGSFSYGSHVAVKAISVLPDGMILVGGHLVGMSGGLNSASEFIRPGIARFYPNAELDNNFVAALALPASKNQQVVTSVLRQEDGKILISGYFLLKIGSPSDPFPVRNLLANVARLRPDGSVDTSFQSNVALAGNASTTIDAMALQTDGKILIAGPFTSIDGQPAPGLARLNADGGLDLTFKPGAGADQPIRTIALQPDGAAFVGGDFTYFNDALRPVIARLPVIESMPTPRARIQSFAGNLIISWPLAIGDFAVEATDNIGIGANWRTLLVPVETVGSFQQVVLPIDQSQSYFRLRKK